MADELNGLSPVESTQLLEPNLAKGSSQQYTSIMETAQAGRLQVQDPLAYTYTKATYAVGGKVQANTHHLISGNVANDATVADFFIRLASATNGKYSFDIDNPRNLMALPTTDGARMESGKATSLHSGYPNEHIASDAALKAAILKIEDI